MLSYSEVNKYFPKGDDRICHPTDYAIKNGVSLFIFDKKNSISSCGWWLRSPGITQARAAIVSNTGSRISDNVSINSFGVRPAMWVNLDYVLGNKDSQSSTDEPGVYGWNDVYEDDWFSSSVKFVYKSGMMQAIAEDRFGAADDTSMGELCGVYCAMLGVANSPEESIALLAQYGVLTPDTTVDEKLTREDLIIMSYYFCALVGIEPGESTLGEYPDAAEADPELAGILAWLLDNGLMAAHDGELKLTENANRADAAQLLTTLYKMIF